MTDNNYVRAGIKRRDLNETVMYPAFAKWIQSYRDFYQLWFSLWFYVSEGANFISTYIFIIFMHNDFCLDLVISLYPYNTYIVQPVVNINIVEYSYRSYFN